MTTWIKIARTHLVGGMNYLAYPWLILGLNFFIADAISSAVSGQKNFYSGEVFSIYAAFLAMGVLSVVRWLPFTLALGASRRDYFIGVTFLALALSLVDGLALALLQILERVTGGWGSSLQFFRVPYIFGGPWYLTWLTSFVLLTVCFVWGMWFGIVYKRWSLFGLLSFISVQVIVVTLGVVAANQAHAWHSIGHFFTTLSIEGLTGLLAVLAVLLLTGGLTTIRRVTV
jgi:hypothetical protein